MFRFIYCYADCGYAECHYAECRGAAENTRQGRKRTHFSEASTAKKKNTTLTPGGPLL